MPRFSQRQGVKPPFNSGLHEVSPELRTAAWNLLRQQLIPDNPNTWQIYKNTATRIWAHLHWQTDQVPHHPIDGEKKLKEHWFRCDWAEFFDLLELSVAILVERDLQAHSRTPDRWYELANQMLARLGCAYRFINRELGPITNPEEIAEIERAARAGVDPVTEHLQEAINQLPPNPNASPRKSVDEAILAVEAVLKHLTSSGSSTLGEGLKEFEKRYGALRPGLKRGFEKLYAYTNGADGIRHAMTEEAQEVTVDEARFMLITCSAFTNYLIAVANRAK
jgi:hypothetical protein